MKVLLRVAVVCLIAATILFIISHRNHERLPPQTEAPASADDASSGVEVYAAWYDVPADSLAKRRAGEHELTAAHDSLPLGTRVRVTHLANGKSVVLRVTDRGITNRKVKIDLCKQAAEKLDMVSKGIARVRMQVLPEEEGGGSPVADAAAAQK